MRGVCEDGVVCVAMALICVFLMVIGILLASLGMDCRGSLGARDSSFRYLRLVASLLSIHHRLTIFGTDYSKQCRALPETVSIPSLCDTYPILILTSFSAIPFR